MKKIRKRLDFIHHQRSGILSVIREIVFGAEDGMVSTLGVLTGIAIGTNNHFVVVLSGFVVVIVESISMGVGSYLSAKSVKEIAEHKLKEEKIQLKKWPEEERRELSKMYIKDGWPPNLAEKMVLTASKNKTLFLKEMIYRELRINPAKLEKVFLGGVFMFFAYIIGGSIPIFPYLFFPISSAIILSIGATLFGLFILGSMTTKFTKRKWWKAGLEMLSLAGMATLVGYVVGIIADSFIAR